MSIKASSYIIIPYKTLIYNDKYSNGKIKSIPVCTLIQHCIEWSRDKFSVYFGNIINKVKKFFVNRNSFKENITKEGSPKYQLDKLKILK